MYRPGESIAKGFAGYHAHRNFNDVAARGQRHENRDASILDLALVHSPRPTLIAQCRTGFKTGLPPQVR